jgi:predicted transposase YdaD
MAHRYDVSLKSLFLREGDGIIRRLLFGGRVVEHLSTEQPQVLNNRADMVVRTEDGAAHQVEFQARNEADFALRMMGYYTFWACVLREHVSQTVLYMGREPLRMPSGYQSPSMDFRFEIINLREIDAAPLLASEDWADVALALLAKGDWEEALRVAVSRLSQMEKEERAWASGTLVLLSGILGIEETVNERMKEAGMIDLLENKVVGPLLLEAERKGRLEGKLEGKLEGERHGRLEGERQGRLQGLRQGLRDLLEEQLTDKFGPLPVWASERLDGASAEEFHLWAKRVLRAGELEEVFRVGVG